MFHSFIISITTIYYVHIYYLTSLILFTPLLLYFILFHCIHTTYEIMIYNSYAISNLVIIIIIIIIIIQSPSYILHQHIYDTI